MNARNVVDSLGRKNPAAWAAWANAKAAPVEVGIALEGFQDGRRRKGGWGSRTRRRLARAAERIEAERDGGAKT